MSNLVQLRAKKFREIRDFFYHRNVLEVDPPFLSRTGSIDTHIDLLKTNEPTLYLHSSPEYPMKRLLSRGSGDIYFLGHVFRKEEEGSKHTTEFTMLEWYRVKTTEELFLKEVSDLLSIFLGSVQTTIYSYEKAWTTFTSLPIEASLNELKTFVDVHAANWSKTDLIHYIWATHIEPKFDPNILTIINDFPKSEASLAKTCNKNGQVVAERFELFYGGMELGNGFHELSDPVEQRKRFEEANRNRILMQKEPYPIDEAFLKDLINLPDTYGIAIGIDRLFMLHAKARHIKEIHPLS